MQDNEDLQVDPPTKQRKVVVCEECIKLQINLIKIEGKLDSTKNRLGKKITEQAKEIKSLRSMIKSQGQENETVI